MVLSGSLESKSHGLSGPESAPQTPDAPESGPQLQTGLSTLNFKHYYTITTVYLIITHFPVFVLIINK